MVALRVDTAQRLSVLFEAEATEGRLMMVPGAHVGQQFIDVSVWI